MVPTENDPLYHGCEEYAELDELAAHANTLYVHEELSVKDAANSVSNDGTYEDSTGQRNGLYDKAEQHQVANRCRPLPLEPQPSADDVNLMSRHPSKGCEKVTRTIRSD